MSSVTFKHRFHGCLPERQRICLVTRGVTLVELLIVIGIMVAVMAVAIPVVRLTSNDNRVSLATQAVRSFLMEAAAAAERDGKSHVVFERNINNPNYCYRLYRGRPRQAYRGEDETAYAISAPVEHVILPGIPAPMQFDVFYLFNADASRILPYEYLELRDRPEKYLIYQSFQVLNPLVSERGPVAKVYCRLDPQIPLSPGVARSGLRQAGIRGEFLQIAPLTAPHNGWLVASTTEPRRASDGQIAQFWPADPVFYSAGTAIAMDIPNFVGGQFVSHLLAFEISQPPMLDELNYVDLPQGMAIYLGGSGFGEWDFPNSPEFVQFALYKDPFATEVASLSDPLVATVINRELLDMTSRSFIGNETSPTRAQYFPRIEFEAGGKITRAFVASARYTAAGSVNVPNSREKIARLGPIYPLSPMYLLIGEDNFSGRDALPADMPILPNDYWIMLGAQTSTPKIVKAQAGLNLRAAHFAVAGSVSER